MRKPADVSPVLPYIDYDPITGIMQVKESWSRKTPIGKELGTVTHKGYLVFTFKQTQYQVHRVAYAFMTGSNPTELIDHKNHIGIDNRWINLRHITHKENMQNRKGKSHVLGVRECHKTPGKYEATIGVDNKQKHLGTFNTLEQAIQARKSAEKEYGYFSTHGV